jgi:hypothetical protein
MMPGSARGYILIGSHYHGWQISQRFCLCTRWLGQGINIQVSPWWPTWSDWNSWFNFWHNFTTTGDILKDPLGNWISPTHHIWKWYYRADTDDLQWVEGNTIFSYKPSSGFRFTQATRTFHLMQEEPLLPSVIQGIPTSVTGFSDQQVVKLSEGPALVKAPDKMMDFWEFLYSWGGKLMWEGIEAGKDSPYDMSWVAEGMTNNSLAWVADGSYDRKKANDLCGVGWIIFVPKQDSA